jgi:hypothetical protein
MQQLFGNIGRYSAGGPAGGLSGIGGGSAPSGGAPTP